MPVIIYTVRAECRDIHQRGRFLSWLAPNHLLQVKAGGATSVRVILPERKNDATSVAVETQYVFPSRKAFDNYVRNHAPALRADALEHFPPESRVTFTQQIAELACELE